MSSKTWLALLFGVLVVGVGLWLLLGGHRAETPHQNITEAQVLVYRDADVQEIKVDVSSGGVAVAAHGVLSDACTEVSSVMQDRDGSQFYITILSARPEGAICSQVIAPFEEVIPLENTAALPTGKYAVDVNGISKAFSVP